MVDMKQPKLDMGMFKPERTRESHVPRDRKHPTGADGQNTGVSHGESGPDIQLLDIAHPTVDPLLDDVRDIKRRNAEIYDYIAETDMTRIKRSRMRCVRLDGISIESADPVAASTQTVDTAQHPTRFVLTPEQDTLINQLFEDGVMTSLARAQIERVARDIGVTINEGERAIKARFRRYRDGLNRHNRAE